MPESELSKRMRKAIKIADKLISDIQKGIRDLDKAAKELKDIGKKEDNEPGGLGEDEGSKLP